MENGITIVVCTYNGASLLPETLAHIAQQQVPPHISWEVIVVDNASTDNTSEVIRAEWAKHRQDVAFSLLHQPRQGLTFARELALKEARYSYILFCDDDNWLAPNYVGIAHELMEEHESIGVLGGYGELVYEVPPSAWAAALPLFANGRQAKQSGKVWRNAVYGAGCVIRKAAFDELFAAGFEPMLTDRSASKLTSGGDYEMCYGLVLAGYDIWYDERLLFKHFMPKKRLEWAYYDRFFKERAQCFEVLMPYQIITNSTADTVPVFYFKLTHHFLRHLRQFYHLILNQLHYSTNSDEAKINTLKLMACKARLKSFRRYRTMETNFAKILKFKQSKLPAVKESRPSYTSPKKIRMKLQ
ncbi:glycosyltransferase family 2 protein [Pontibacter sp. E15-1]|uniref:glycosyltransferase n=1 Tax=Pontibacter sp. E15-1 TaxID=2919918 RepID=UPI001F4FC14A|nr:glycosyltransferase [Pontibacter sp. E15-1]MCJ8165337.1 glycosyltransferase family 2 protein [Pontibacter sp. E15-1]